MNPSSRFGAYRGRGLAFLWEDDERVVCRAWRRDADGARSAVLAVFHALEHPSPANLDRPAHEYALKDELDGAWAVRPRELGRDRGRTMLVLEDPGGEPLQRLIRRAHGDGTLLAPSDQHREGSGQSPPAPHPPGP